MKFRPVLLMLLFFGGWTDGSLIDHNDTENDHPPNETHNLHRHMQAREFQQRINRAVIDTAHNRPGLACNEDLQSAKCHRWSIVISEADVYEEPVVVPCGTCVWVDVPRLVFRGGLHVRGKLIIPQTSRNTTFNIRATNILVEGELQVTATKPVDGTPVVELGFFESDVPDTSCFGSTKGMVISGGKVKFNGLPSDTPTWVNLVNVIEDPDAPDKAQGIIVDNSVSEKWVEGAEILITSHTNRWDGHQVRTIQKIDQYDDRHVSILLSRPIERPLTIRNNRDFAVEVALLSRNIRFKAEVHDEIGGHFIVQNTNRTQSVVGVEFRGFGQQGCLGRYPIHWHLCGDVQGSVIRKNTIRESNQRCIVVHGTDNLEISENIAYDTKGHCFVLEDGIEKGNTFYRNLGAQTGRPNRSIPDLGPNGFETDIWPSTFWITTPTNTWTDNVAAGSEGSGFWFELLKRGVRQHLYPNWDPKTAPLGLFRNNIAHSNADRGLRLYPSGYQPRHVQTISGMKCFRNVNMGIFFHNSRNIALENAFVADNGSIGIDVDKSEGITVVDSTVIGVSESFHGDFNPHCRTVGIDLHTWKSDTYQDGVAIEKTTFSGFNRSRCPNAMPIRFDPNTNTQQFDSLTTVRRVDFTDAGDLVDFCMADAAEVTDAYLTDLDGSLAPSFMNPNGISTAVGYQSKSLIFVDKRDCQAVPDLCYQYCKKTCFRMFRFGIDPAETEDFKLEVCRGGKSRRCIRILGPKSADPIDTDLYDSSDHRMFLVHLPEDGFFDAVFLDSNNDETWPSFVSSSEEKSPCVSGAGRISLYKPNIPAKSNLCDQLIRNGDVEASNSEPKFWLHRFGGLRLAPGKGMDRSNALDGIFPSGTAGIVQYLDSRCLEENRGRFYQFRAYIRLESNNGDTFFCDPDHRPCPKIGLFLVPGGYHAIAQVEPYAERSDGFQLALGYAEIDDQMAEATEVQFSIQSNVDGKRMYVDNASIKIVPDEFAYCKNLILNSESSLERMWELANGSGTVTTVKVVGNVIGLLSSTAIRFGNRKSFEDGIVYSGWREIETACLKPGSRWLIAAKLFLVDRETGGGVSCDEDCPLLRLALHNEAGSDYFFVYKSRSYSSSSWVANGWNRFWAAVELPLDKEHYPVYKAVLEISDFPAEYDLMVADFSMKPDLND